MDTGAIKKRNGEKETRGKIWNALCSKQVIGRNCGELENLGRKALREGKAKSFQQAVTPCGYGFRGIYKEGAKGDRKE